MKCRFFVIAQKEKSRMFFLNNNGSFYCSPLMALAFPTEEEAYLYLETLNDLGDEAKNIYVTEMIIKVK